MNVRTLLFVVLPIFLVSACSKAPSWVIPEEEMERLLVDIHLAEALIDNDYNTFSDSAGKAQLFHSIFEKHEVTKAKFDTSLVWYASHLDLYMSIYERVSKNLLEINDTLSAHIAQVQALEARAKYVWEKDSMIVLKPFPSENRYTFRIDTSSYFSQGDMYALHVFALGINAQNKPKITFAWETQDTVLVDRTEIKHNGPNVFYLTALPGKNTKSLYGSIRLPIDEAPSSRLVIDHLFIVRHREGHYPEIKVEEEVVEEEIAEEPEITATADTISPKRTFVVPDSLVVKPVIATPK